ncbi:MAG TPA: hypothetical protein VHM25_16950 [Polyangiaceae bacterium]|jgi:hypothetical protein|nr:hypothetical protein [Polyangiaceae bacterium]
MLQHSMTRLAQFGLGVVVAASLLGCTGVLGIDSERTLATSAPLPAEWSCLDDTPPAPWAAATLNQRFKIIDKTGAPAIPSKPVAGLSVRACARIDFDCTSPVGPSVLTGTDGIASVSVPNGFSGYFEVTGRDEYQPLMILERPVTADALSEITVVNKKTFAAFAGAAGTTLHTDTGELALWSRNCNGVGASGLVFDIKSNGDVGGVVYLANSLPTAEATQTDSSGVAEAFNVFPGTISATAKANDGSFEVANRSGVIRVGWQTQMNLYPDQLVLPP